MTDPNALPPTTAWPMRLSRVEPNAGIAWTREGWRTFARHPFGFTSLFAVLMTAALLLSTLGTLGAILVAVSLPLMSLVFMVATQAVVEGRVKHPLQALAAFKSIDAQRARALVLMCVAYAVAMTLVFSVSTMIDQGSWQRLLELLAAPRTEATAAEIRQLMESENLHVGLWARILGTLVLSTPFWHAPALVWWGHQGVMQSLFSSTLGLWRCKGAYVLYSLALLASSFVLMSIVGVALMLFSSGSMVRVAIAAMSMVMAVVFYASLWSSFVDTFGLRKPEDAENKVD